MTEHEYEQALTLIRVVERDLRIYLRDPSAFHIQYIESLHCDMTQVMTLLKAEPLQTGYEDLNNENH